MKPSPEHQENSSRKTFYSFLQPIHRRCDLLFPVFLAGSGKRFTHLVKFSLLSIRGVPILQILKILKHSLGHSSDVSLSLPLSVLSLCCRGIQVPEHFGHSSRVGESIVSDRAGCEEVPLCLLCLQSFRLLPLPLSLHSDQLTTFGKLFSLSSVQSAAVSLSLTHSLSLSSRSFASAFAALIPLKGSSG